MGPLLPYQRAVLAGFLDASSIDRAATWAAPIWMGVDMSSSADISAVAIVKDGRVSILPPACADTMLALYRDRA